MPQVFVPSGKFQMGGFDIHTENDELPVHEVALHEFWIDQYEVTNGMYGLCVQAGVCLPPQKSSSVKRAEYFGNPEFQDYPVTTVTWSNAQTYCAWAGRRLLTEAEWERAARGEDGRRYPWGNAAPDRNRHGCFARALGTAEGTTCAVGSFPAGAGPYGHHDLAGNVWEWMADYYDPFAYRRPGAAQGEPGECQQILETQDWLRQNQRQGFTGTNPIPVSCERVLRGGAFNCPASGLRSSNRVHHPGDWRLLMAGARCAKDRHAQREDAVGSTVP
jgi:formylglycine-generating enzyme required for sulfatase activity